METDLEKMSNGSVSAAEDSICRHAKYSLGKAWRDLSPVDLFTAVALSVRDRMVDRFLETKNGTGNRIRSGYITFRSSF